MALSFIALASVAVLLVLLSTTITYLSVITLQLPFVGVLAAMIVVGVLNAVLRTAVLSNFRSEERPASSAPHPVASATKLTNATPEEVAFLFVAYLLTAIAQFFILRSRFTLHERTVIIGVTGASNALFRNLL
jgi:hypothetical protein